MALSTADFQRDITFKQSQGYTRGGKLVKFAQDEILLNGVRVGYVGHGENGSAALLKPLDDDTVKAISDAITEHRGSAPQRVMSAPGVPDESEGGDDE